MEAMEKKERIIEIIKELKQLPEFDESIGLIETGLIDSFDIMNLIMQLEEGFKVTINGDDLVPENFLTVSDIARMIDEKLQ